MITPIELRLSSARERKGLTLQILERRIGVKASVLELIERGAFEALPTGLYGRHAVRSYLRAIGFPEGEALAEIAPRLKAPEDPLDGLARVRGLGRKRTRHAEHEGVVAPVAASGASDFGAELAREIAASAIDGLLLTSIVLALFWLTALAAGTTVREIAALAAPAIALVSVLVAGVYFVVLGGVRNATFGAHLAGAATAGPAGPIGARTALRRGLRCALRERSMLAALVTAGRRVGCAVACAPGGLRGLLARGAASMVAFLGSAAASVTGANRYEVSRR
jgi:transcriptional regulator with XRE-family HTH domain